MLEEILFKAKRVDNGKWVEGIPFEIEGKTVILIRDNENLLRTHYIEENMWTAEIYAIEVIPHSICRYTGLTDKNGKEIWENDILMSHKDQSQLVKVVFGEFAIVDAETLEAVDHAIGWHYEVIPTYVLDEYKPFCFSMPLTSNYIDLCEFEVIGNIFDIPELVRGEAK